jgi:protein-L-isoaspartate O-methyltransferase
VLHAATDRAWEMIGRSEPYFGVLVESKYKASSLTEPAREDFFRSGEEYVARMIQTIRRHFDHTGAFERALDFGCGVGRLAIPLAKHAAEVVGVDVSDAMLTEAARNCRRSNCANITFHKGNGRLTPLDGDFDLIHTYIVLQHVPVRHGYRIVANLITRLQAGGVGVVHVTYDKDSVRQKWISWIRKYVPGVVPVLNAIKRRPFFAPHMQMNDYDLNRLVRMLHANQIPGFHAEHTNHGGHLGLILYFRKPHFC